MCLSRKQSRTQYFKTPFNKYGEINKFRTEWPRPPTTDEMKTMIADDKCKGSGTSRRSPEKRRTIVSPSKDFTISPEARL